MKGSIYMHDIKNKKNAIISIIGEQFFEHTDSEVIELITDGTFYQKLGKFFIRYNESELTGLEGVTTTITIDNDMVSLLRTGALTSELVFEKGKRHISLYNTEDGAFTVTVNTSQINNTLNVRGGSLEVSTL